MASATIQFEVIFNDKAIQDKFQHVFSDDSFRLALHNRLAQRCDKYVPFLEGPLSQTAEITPEYVRYHTPYAHRQYYLHDMWADLNGETNRTRERHPLATSYWDQAMFQLEGDAFMNDVKDLIVWRYKQLYGN